MRNRERAPRPRHRSLAQPETTSGRYTRMTAARDAIVIGSGHNGLVAAAYLARAGLSVEVLERNAVAGGAVASEELTQPGFLHDTFSAWHPLFKLSAAYGELGPELAERGLAYAENRETAIDVRGDVSTPQSIANLLLTGSTAVLTGATSPSGTIAQRYTGASGSTNRGWTSRVTPCRSPSRTGGM